MNHYANKKSAAESMLDVALLMANASQLKAVLEQGPEFSFYTPLIVLISISLLLQILVGVMLIFIGMFGWTLLLFEAWVSRGVLSGLLWGFFFFLRIIFSTVAKQFQFESFQFTDLLPLRESDYNIVESSFRSFSADTCSLDTFNGVQVACRLCVNFSKKTPGKHKWYMC